MHSKEQIFMKEHRRTLVLDEFEKEQIDKLLTEEPKENDDRFSGECVLDYGVVFDNGFSASAQIVEVTSYEPNCSNLPWTQAVLFDPDGHEVDCTEVCDEFFGAWYLTYDNELYVLVIESKDEEEGENKDGKN